MAKVQADNSTAYSRLTGRQQQFVLAYLQCFNAAKAAREAGYSGRSAMQIGHENMRKHEIGAAISELLDSKGLSPERIKVAVGEIAFGADLADFEDFLKKGTGLAELRKAGVNTQFVKAAVISKTESGVNRRIEMLDRLAALEKLIRVMGMVTEKREITGGVGVDLTNMSDAELKRLRRVTNGDSTDKTGSSGGD